MLKTLLPFLIVTLVAASIEQQGSASENVIQAEVEQGPVSENVSQAEVEQGPVSENVSQAEVEQGPASENVIQAEVEQESDLDNVIEAEIEQLGPTSENVSQAGVLQRPVSANIVQVRLSATSLDNQIFTTANYNFSIVLYQHLLRSGLSNLVVSPFSLSTLMTMVFVGARRRTGSEIRETLGYESLSKFQVCGQYRNTMQSFKTSTDCVLNIANSVWNLESFNVSEKYKKRLSYSFDTKECSFNMSTGLARINDWVANKTNNNIPQLLSELPEDSVLLLLSALYFRGPWKTSFDPHQTVMGNFYGTETAETMFMNVEDNFGYHECGALSSRILELPYKGEDISMFFLLPDSSSSLSDMEMNLSFETLSHCLRNVTVQNVHVAIPKFDISSEFDLEAPLRTLGINSIFESTANLKGISEDGGLQVSRVIQKATLKVSEEGAEASATSAAIFYLRSATISNAKQFRANRPFLYLLMHKPTNHILFMGRYSKVPQN